MDELNLHHLRYFWTVVRTGSIAAASRELRVTQPTISTQIKQLEQALGEDLLERAGRGLAPTDLGRLVFSYAEEIFSLAREMVDTVRHEPEGRPLRLRVGVADAIPKLVARRLLAPVFRLDRPVHVICNEGKAERLEAELSSYGLDLVLADAPLSPRVKVRAFSHLLGSCGVTICAAVPLARTLRRGFPKSLDGAPMLLPVENSALRRMLDRWLRRHDVRPRIVAEIEDSALLKEFGADGLGAFAVPSVIEKDVKRHYKVGRVGEIADVQERFYAITPERRLKHPAVVALCADARERLLA